MLNLGRNYYSLDIPVTYTYFNPKSGIDISLTAGLMVNWRNPDTDYRTGNEFHVDWLVGNVEQRHRGTLRSA